MLTHTEAFETAARNIIRKAKARIEITWTDPFLDTSIDISVNNSNRITWPDHVANLLESPSYRWAHLDNGLKADNTFYPCPSNVSESRNYEMGWWSDSISGTDNNFSIPYPKLTMTFSERPILAFSVIGDDNYNEYPVNFEIKIYGVGDILLHTETVTGNNNVRWFKSIIDEAINSAVKMTLEITRWNQPERVLKIVEFYTSLVETYENEDIVSMNLLEESIISDGSLPIGNISANELDFSLQNVRIFAQGQWINDPFFPGNTNSYLHTLIKNNRRIRVWLGFELPSLAMEYMPLGTFWSGDWTIEETDSMVSTSCRDRMELLRQATFIGDTLYENVSLYTLAIAVLQHAKDNIPMPDLYWSVDIELQNFVVPYAWFARKTYMTAIKDIVTACMGKAYMSREDILIITI